MWNLWGKGSTFDIEIRGKEYRVRIPVPGIHNVTMPLQV